MHSSIARLLMTASQVNGKIEVHMYNTHPNSATLSYAKDEYHRASILGDRQRHQRHSTCKS